MASDRGGARGGCGLRRWMCHEMEEVHRRWVWLVEVGVA